MSIIAYDSQIMIYKNGKRMKVAPMELQGIIQNMDRCGIYHIQVITVGKKKTVFVGAKDEK